MALLDPAPTREAAGSPAWTRWFNQLYTAIQNLLTGGSFTNPTLTNPSASGGTFTNPTLAGTVTVSSPASLIVGSNWQSWTPAVTCSGSMTASALTVNDAQYLRLGPWCDFKLYVQVTLGGTASSQVLVSLPYALVGQSNACAGYYNQGAWNAPGFCLTSGSTVVSLLPNAANFALGTLYLMISGRYRVS